MSGRHQRYTTKTTWHKSQVHKISRILRTVAKSPRLRERGSNVPLLAKPPRRLSSKYRLHVDWSSAVQFAASPKLPFRRTSKSFPLLHAAFRRAFRTFLRRSEVLFGPRHGSGEIEIDSRKPMRAHAMSNCRSLRPMNTRSLSLTPHLVRFDKHGSAACFNGWSIAHYE